MANSIRGLLDDIKKNRAIYLMVLPVALYFFILNISRCTER